MPIADLGVPTGGAIQALPVPGATVTPEQADVDAFTATAGATRRGLRSGVNSALSMVNQLAGATGETMGLTEFAASRYKDAEEYAKMSEATGNAVRDVSQIKDLASLLDFGFGAFGSGLATSAPAIALGVGLRRPVLGVMAGSAPLEAGEQIGNLRADPTVMANTTPGQRLLNAGAKGTINSLIDAGLGVEGQAVRRMIKPTVESAGKAILKGTVGEGLTEGAQNLVGQKLHQELNPEKQIDTHDILNDIAAGAAGGGGISAGAHAVGQVPGMIFKTADELRSALGRKDKPVEPDALPDGVENMNTAEEIVGAMKDKDEKDNSSLEKAWQAVKDNPAYQSMKDWMTDPEKRTEFAAKIKQDYNESEYKPKIEAALKWGKEKADGLKDFIDKRQKAKYSEMENRPDMKEIQSDVLAGNPIYAGNNSPEVVNFLAKNGYKEESNGKWVPLAKRSDERTTKDDEIHRVVYGATPQGAIDTATPKQLVQLSDMVRNLAEHPDHYLETGVPHTLKKVYGDKFEPMMKQVAEILGTDHKSISAAFRTDNVEEGHKMEAVKNLIRSHMLHQHLANPEHRQAVLDELAPKLLDFVQEKGEMSKEFRQRMSIAFGSVGATKVLEGLDKIRDLKAPTSARAYEEEEKPHDVHDDTAEPVVGMTAANKRMKELQQKYGPKQFHFKMDRVDEDTEGSAGPEEMKFQITAEPADQNALDDADWRQVREPESQNRSGLEKHSVWTVPVWTWSDKVNKLVKVEQKINLRRLTGLMMKKEGDQTQEGDAKYVRDMFNRGISQMLSSKIEDKNQPEDSPDRWIDRVRFTKDELEKMDFPSKMIVVKMKGKDYTYREISQAYFPPNTAAVKLRQEIRDAKPEDRKKAIKGLSDYYSKGRTSKQFANALERDAIDMIHDEGPDFFDEAVEPILDVLREQEHIVAERKKLFDNAKSIQKAFDEAKKKGYIKPDVWKEWVKRKEDAVKEAVAIKPDYQLMGYLHYAFENVEAENEKMLMDQQTFLEKELQEDQGLTDDQRNENTLQGQTEIVGKRKFEDNGRPIGEGGAPSTATPAEKNLPEPHKLNTVSARKKYHDARRAKNPVSGMSALTNEAELAKIFNTKQTTDEQFQTWLDKKYPDTKPYDSAKTGPSNAVFKTGGASQLDTAREVNRELDKALPKGAKFSEMENKVTDINEVRKRKKAEKEYAEKIETLRETLRSTGASDEQIIYAAEKHNIGLFKVPTEGPGGSGTEHGEFFMFRNLDTYLPESGWESSVDKAFNELYERDRRRENPTARERADDIFAEAELKAAWRKEFPNIEFSTMNVGKGPVDPAKQKEVEDYIHFVLGDKVAVKFIKDMKAAGAFANLSGIEAIMISTDAIDPMSVGFHEAAHALFARLVKADPKAAHVLMRAASAPVIVSRLNELLKGHPRALKQLSDPEERVAYMYQFWAQGEKYLQIGTETKTWFDKVKNFFKAIGAFWADDLNTLQSIRQSVKILDAFHNGEFSDRNTVAEVLHEKFPPDMDAKSRAIFPALGKFMDKFILTASGAVRDMNIPQLTDIMDKFFVDPTATGKSAGFIQAKYQEANKFTNRVVDAMKDLKKSEQRAVLEELQAGEAKSPTAVKIRDILDDLHDYLVKADVKMFEHDPATGKIKYNKGNPVYKDLNFVKDYFPRVYDQDYVRNHKDEFLAVLKANGIKNPQQAYDNVTRPVDHKPEEEDYMIGLTYYTPQVNERALADIPAEALAPFQNKDLFGTMQEYIQRAARRAEYTRRFGNVGETIRDARAAAFEAGMTKAQADVFDESVQAMEGSLGANMSPQLKSIYGALMTYQNIRLLPLALFSSFVDPLGIMVRGGTLVEAGAAFVRGIKELAGVNKDEAYELAKTVGAINAATDAGLMSEMYNSQYMPKVQRAINDTFFKYNGMESWNRSMRVAASAAAERFIIRHVEKPTKDSERYLKQLDLTADDVSVVNDKLVLNDKISRAINTWVDGAILRPNAAMRPIYMSDPNYMLISHLKQYTYLFQKVMIARVHDELAHGNYTPAYTLAGFVPVIVAADMMRYALTPGGGDDAAHAGWTMWDWIWRGIQRAGIFGYSNFAFESVGDMSHNKLFFESAAGPTIQQFIDVGRAAATGQGIGKEALNAVPIARMFK